MPRRRSRSPNDRISNRRPNFNSPQKRIGAQMSRSTGRFSPRRSGSPNRHQHSRPQQQQQQRVRSQQRATIGPDRSRNLSTESPFARSSRPAVKRSRSPLPTRHRNSTSPLNKKLMIRKSSPIRTSKSVGMGRGGREKRMSVSPNETRRKRTPPGRMEATNRRDSSRLTSSLGHAKREFGSPSRMRGQLSNSPIAMKIENQNNKPEDRRAKPNKSFRPDTVRNQIETFQTTEKIDDGDILTPTRTFRNEFSANIERDTSSFHRDRRDMKRFQSNLDELYAHKNTDRLLRADKELMEDRLGHSDEGISGPAYDPEELKKITVDIRRNIPRDGDVILRRITNPDEVVLVRRPEEGVRPIFDRDEIKQGNLEREEEFREKRVVAIVRERGRSRSPIQTIGNQSEMHENFKVHRVSNYDSEAFQSRPSLSDRWQHDRKLANTASANEKLLVSVRPGSPQMIRKLANYRSHDDDDLYQEMQTRVRTTSYHDDSAMLRLSSRDSDERHRDSFDTRRPIPTNPHDLRHSLISRGRPIDLLDARQKILERQEREPTHSYERKERGGSMERLRILGAVLDRERNREKFRADKLEGLPNFAARRDRYQYKEWIDKPDVVPKGPSYFEHDTRGEGNHEFRRGQGFRGLSRGSSFRGRGGFRARGRSNFTANYVTRRFVERGRSDQVGGLGKRSPHQWEHDMFEPADMKMDQDNRPI